MARNNQAENEIAARRMRVAQLYLQGIPQYQIAQQLKVSAPSITRDLAAIREEWLQSSILNYDARKAQELARVDFLEAEAHAAWERSKAPKKRDRAKKVELPGKAVAPVKGKAQTPAPGSQRREAETITEGRDGNPKFLGEIRACVELRAKITGILPTKEREPLDVLLEYLPAELAAAVRAELDKQLSAEGSGDGGQPATPAAPVP